MKGKGIFLIFIIGFIFTQVNADITGKISDQAGKPIAGATVKLVKNGATTTSGSDGRYTLTTTDVKKMQIHDFQNKNITIQNGFLNFTISEAAPVKYEIFDIKGNLLRKKVLENVPNGIYRFNITENLFSTKTLIIKASIGKEEKTFYYLSLNNKNGIHSLKVSSLKESVEAAQISTVIDTLKVTANGYKPQTIPVTSYNIEINVTMEPSTNGNCGEFTIISSKMSTAIPTVGIIEWSYSQNVTNAYIEFWLEGSNNVLKAPVDLKEKNYRTLLLGMKQQKKYQFHIVVETGSGTCTSKDSTLTTGTISSAPKITKTGSGSSSIKKGFIVTTTGNGWAMGGGMGGGGSSPMAVIFDLDGDVVWAASAPKGTSRARMSWDGKYMWVNNANVGNANPATAGEMRRISMDGLVVERNIAGLSGAHHDFTVTPKNEIITIAYTSNGSSSSQILCYSPDGKITTIVADVTTLYKPSGDCHPNYIQYDPSDDSFIISDRNPNLFVKFLRNGTLVWQFGGSNPKGKSFSVSVNETWQANHGFEMEADGRFVFFNNESSMTGGMSSGQSKIREFKLDESKMTATKLWEKNTNGSSFSLGDVQRLPDNHYLVTVSNAGRMEILDSSRNVVLSFTTSEFGYTEYRETLYGPPNDY